MADADRLRLAILRVLREQLTEAKRTAAVLETTYDGITSEAMHALGDMLAAHTAFVAALIDVEPKGRVDWCPSCAMQQVIDQDGLCSICGLEVPSPRRSISVLEGGEAA